MNYNIIVGRDYIYDMDAMVSSLFQVMNLPHEGHVTTIECDSPSNYSQGTNSIFSTTLYLCIVSSSSHCEVSTPTPSKSTNTNPRVKQQLKGEVRL